MSERRPLRQNSHGGVDAHAATKYGDSYWKDRSNQASAAGDNVVAFAWRIASRPQHRFTQRYRAVGSDVIPELGPGQQAVINTLQRVQNVVNVGKIIFGGAEVRKRVKPRLEKAKKERQERKLARKGSGGLVTRLVNMVSPDTVVKEIHKEKVNRPYEETPNRRVTSSMSDHDQAAMDDQQRPEPGVDLQKRYEEWWRKKYTTPMGDGRQDAQPAPDPVPAPPDPAPQPAPQPEQQPEPAPVQQTVLINPPVGQLPPDVQAVYDKSRQQPPASAPDAVLNPGAEVAVADNGNVVDNTDVVVIQGEVTTPLHEVDPRLVQESDVPLNDRNQHRKERREEDRTKKVKAK